MIEEYLQHIDELLSASPAVRDIEIIRRTLRDTEWEKILHYRYRVFLSDGGLVEMSERLVEMRGVMTTTKYRHHWQDKCGRLFKRWDNAPHHPSVETFPKDSERSAFDSPSVWHRNQAPAVPQDFACINFFLKISLNGKRP
jgi:hypothetical protein